MARWFTSDIHFGHKNVISYCNRPYSSVQEMEEAIVAQWNSQVSVDDEVYFLGDWGINKTKVFDKELLNRLNGKKHIVLGNHDYGFNRLHRGENSINVCQKYLDCGWVGVSAGTKIMLGNKRLVNLVHLPPCNDEDSRYKEFKMENDPNQWYVHGHTHCHYLKKNNMIDVGFDGELKLLSEDDIIARIEDPREFIPSRITEHYKNRVECNLRPFTKEVKAGNIRQVEEGDLILFNYTDQCTYEKAWNETTLQARGIIFDKTGRIIAKPLEKFFNLGERPETKLENLPKEPYVVTEKMDGSLGIIYRYADEWHVATRGSFSSVQAIKAKELLTKYDMKSVQFHHTLLCEIIYPENKIVVNYGSEEKLVLLAAIDRNTGIEISRDELLKIAERTGMPVVSEYKYTIDEMVALQATLPKDQEGFVVRFESGLRVKIKGTEYLRIHKLISQMSPLSFWESLKEGKVNVDYLQELPEEYRKDADVLVEQIEGAYNKIAFEIQFVTDAVVRAVGVGNMKDPAHRKTVGLYLQEYDLTHKPGIFATLDNQPDKLDKYIIKQCRPTGNVIT